MNIKKETILLFFIVALGIIIRLWGIEFGLPDIFHQDEPMAVNKAISYGNGDFNPHYFQLPPLLSYILFFLYGIFYLAGKLLHIFAYPDDFLKLYLADPTIFYLIARLAAGFIPGVLSIIFIYKLSEQVSTKRAALLAALFLSVSFIHVAHSHYAYHDILLTLFLILTFINLFKYIEKKDTRYMITAAAAAGIATGFKYNGALIIVPALIVPWFGLTSGKVVIRNAIRLNILFILTFIFVFMLTNPFAVFDIKTFLNSFIAEKQAHNYIGWLHHIRYSAFEGMGILMSLVSTIGFFCFLFSRDTKKRVISIFVFVFYISIVYLGQVHERYILPIVPFLLLISASCIDGFMHILKTKKVQIIFLISAVLFLNITSFMKSVYSDILFSRKDSRTQAKEWMLDNISEGKRIALDHPFFSPRLMQTAEQIEQKIDIMKGRDGPRTKKAEILMDLSKGVKSYNVYFLNYTKEAKFIFSSYPPISFNVKELLEKGIDYVVLHLDYPAEQYPDPKFREELLKKATLIKVFMPFRDEGFDLGAEVSTTAAPFRMREIFNRTNNGPVLLLYKLNRQKDNQRI